MLVQRHRFRGLGSLKFVYARGRVIRGDGFSLRYARNNRRQTYRVAVIVSKKVAKAAVVRNRIRRKMFEAIRSIEIPEALSYDLVFSVYSSTVADLPLPQLQKRTRDQLQRAGVL